MRQDTIHRKHSPPPSTIERRKNDSKQTTNVTCLHEVFEAQVDCAPDNIAIIEGDQSFTYLEIEQQANRFATMLLANGVEAGNLVGLFAERSASAIIAMLGVLKAGAGYVPIDPVFPADRIQHILSQSNIQVLLCSKAIKESIEDVHSGHTLVIENILDSAISPLDHDCTERVKVSETDICYVIFTSGSTGRPKGVMTEHRNAVKFIESFKKTCNLTSSDRVLQAFSLGFDGSVEEIWMAFANGARLIIGPQCITGLGSEVAKLIRKHQVTFYSTVPTCLSMIPEDLPSVRLLVVSGEPCPPELISKWAVGNRRMINVYGPTEATVNTTVAECLPSKPVTIGKALDGYELHIMDEKQRPVPKGQSGELYIGGVGIARGYLGEKELTEAAFVTVSLESSDVPQRLYRTGDLVSWNEQHELLFHGRLDTQVKIRGYRIELSEIEAVLMEHPQITTAIVQVHEKEHLKELAAYITVKDPEVDLDIDTLHQELVSSLPKYMIPRYLDILDFIPKLTSGKADRKKLPAPCRPFVPQRSNQQSPATPAEKKLAEVWKQLFEIDEISVNDDFFTDLGGYSLLAANMVSVLRNDFGYELALREVYENPTLRQLAAQMDASITAKDASDAKPASSEAPRRTSSERHQQQSSDSRLLCHCLQACSQYVLYALASVPLLTILFISFAFVGKVLSLNQAIAGGLLVLLGFYPTMLLFSIAAKWLIIGRYKSGRYPLWGSYYFRWWLVSRIQNLSGARLLAGSPLMTLYYRLMGANVGKQCIIDTSLCSAFDLISIGDNSCICHETQVPGYRVEDGELVIGSVSIGKDCFIGIHSYLGLNTRMEDGSELSDLSALNDGETIKAGTFQTGSPSQTIPHPNGSAAQTQSAKPSSDIALGLGSFLAICGMQIFLYLTTIPSLVLFIWAYQSFSLAGQITTAIVAGPLAFGSLCLGVVGFKWVVLKKIKPGQYPIHSMLYLRKWTVDGMLRISRGLLLPLYTTLYFPQWLRWLGARIGVRAEISTVSQISPDLMDLGSESFFADGSIIGGRHFRNGHVILSTSAVGQKSFIGNSAILPIGANVGDDCLIGCLSETPRDSKVPSQTEWLGSPAFQLPYRKKVEGFSESVTFKPTTKLWIQRCFVDSVRILIPSLLATFGTLGLLALTAFTWISKGVLVAGLLAPLYAMGLAGLMVIFVAGFKRLLMGTFKPTIQPLWSMYVWLNEAVNGAYESIVAPILGSLLGTPFAAPLLRLMGCRIGKHVFLETTLFSEFDLVNIADFSAVNAGAVIQNHLFEDRIMKSSHLKIGKDCNVGNMSVILYDSEMKEGATIRPMSLLMKGETLPEHSQSGGIPTTRLTS